MHAEIENCPQKLPHAVCDVAPTVFTDGFMQSCNVVIDNSRERAILPIREMHPHHALNILSGPHRPVALLLVRDVI
jgi:hypothetical protein